MQCCVLCCDDVYDGGNGTATKMNPFANLSLLGIAQCWSSRLLRRSSRERMVGSSKILLVLVWSVLSPACFCCCCCCSFEAPALWSRELGV